MSFSLDTVDSDILAQSWGPSESICRQARCHVTAHCHVSRVTRHAVTKRVSYTGEARTILGCPLSPGEAVTAEAGGTKTISEQKTNKISLPPSPRLRGQLPSSGSPCVGGGVRLLRVARRAVTGRLTLLAAPPRPAVQGPGAGKMRARAETRSRSRGAGAEMLTWGPGRPPASGPQPSRRRTMRSRGLGLARPPQCGDASVVVRWCCCGGAVVLWCPHSESSYNRFPHSRARLSQSPAVVRAAAAAPVMDRAGDGDNCSDQRSPRPAPPRPALQ